MPNEPKEEKKKVVVVEEVGEPAAESAESKDTKTESEISEQTFETSIEEYQDKPNYLWIIIPTALLVGALVGGFITYFSGISNLNQSQSSPSPLVEVVKPTPLPEITPSPGPLVKKEDLKIQVLNGSGISGAAGNAKSYLEKLGYANVEIGNAATANFETTEISAKESKKDYLEVLIKDLAGKYKVSEKTALLSASNKFDIVITLGKK